TAIDRDQSRFLYRDRLALRLERERKTLRQEILDEEGRLSESLQLLVDEEAGAPRSRHRGRGKRERRGAPAKLWFIEDEAAVLDTVWPRYDQCGRRVGCRAGTIAQECDQM